MFAEKIWGRLWWLNVRAIVILIMLGLMPNMGGASASPLHQDRMLDCNGRGVFGATSVEFLDVQPGLTYRVTVIGLDGFDPVLVLYASDGSRACGEDAPEAASSTVSLPDIGLVEADSTAAQLTFETTESTGDLSFTVARYGIESGRYIAVFEGPTISPSTEQDEVQFHVSPAIEEEPLLVYMIAETDDLDSYMAVQGTEIACDDMGAGSCADMPRFSTDSDNPNGADIANGGQYVARLSDAGMRVIPAETGIPAFVFGSYAGRSEGSYAMILVGIEPDLTGQASQTGDLTPMSYGQFLFGTIDDQHPGMVYSFTGEMGDAVTINLDAEPGGNLDPFVILLDALNPGAGPVALSNDITDETPNSRIQVVLPADSEYRIIATRLNGVAGTTTGPFVVALDRLGTDQPVDSSPTAYEPLAYSDVAEGSIDDEDVAHSYLFTAQEGDVVTITMEAVSDSTLDPMLALFDPNDFANPLAVNNDMTSDTTTTQIVYTIPASGDYWIYATRQYGHVGFSGEYVLTLSADQSDAFGGRTSDLEEAETGKSGELGEINLGRDVAADVGRSAQR